MFRRAICIVSRRENATYLVKLSSFPSLQKRFIAHIPACRNIGDCITCITNFASQLVKNQKYERVLRCKRTREPPPPTPPQERTPVAFIDLRRSCFRHWPFIFTVYCLSFFLLSIALTDSLKSYVRPKIEILDYNLLLVHMLRCSH